MAKKKWVFTKARRENIEKARDAKSEMIEYGKPIYYKKHGIKD